MPGREFGLLYWQEMFRLGILVEVGVGVKGDGSCGEELWSLFLVSRDGPVGPTGGTAVLEVMASGTSSDTHRAVSFSGTDKA